MDIFEIFLFLDLFRLWFRLFWSGLLFRDLLVLRQLLVRLVPLLFVLAKTELISMLGVETDDFTVCTWFTFFMDSSSFFPSFNVLDDPNEIVGEYIQEEILLFLMELRHLLLLEEMLLFLVVIATFDC